MSHEEAWSAEPLRAGHAHRIDVLARTLREMTLQVVLPDPQPWESDEIDQDPLSLESLGTQTRRLVLLIERAREQKDGSLLHSLRRELLLTRWALVKLHSARARGTANKRAVLRGKDSRRSPSNHRVRLPHLGRRSETISVSGLDATSTPPVP
ncbi:MAG TPA: hypothetical protein VFV60_06650 [bacterium]|nr:hypothetical protein [bacterium]